MTTPNAAPQKPIASSDIPWTEWSEVPRFSMRYRHLTRAALGNGYHVGMAIEELPPGKQSAPAHYHLLEEEHVYILEGTLTARIGAHSFEMQAGDYVCFPAGQRAGHCLLNRGDAPCRYVIIGERNENDVVVYPDSNKVLIRGLGRRAIFDLAARRGYWHGENTGLKDGDDPPAETMVDAAEAPDEPKPPISSDDLPWEETSIDARFGGRAKHLTLAAVGPTYHVGVMIEAPAPGKRLAPLHYHMREEEQALILEGRVTLLLGDERHDLEPGDYVCFPAGEQTGHSFLNAGPGPCSYLIVGERKPGDVCVYPDSNKMAVSALRTEDCVFDMSARRRYWDGEATG